MNPRKSGRFVSRLTRSTMAMIMAGGRGSRLEDLTESRAKPATPFGGKFRIIDFPLSNCVNSGIRRITSYNVCYTKLLRIAVTVNSDAAVGDRLKVLFVPNYNVTRAEVRNNFV